MGGGYVMWVGGADQVRLESDVTNVHSRCRRSGSATKHDENVAQTKAERIGARRKALIRKEKEKGKMYLDGRSVRGP